MSTTAANGPVADVTINGQAGPEAPAPSAAPPPPSAGSTAAEASPAEEEAAGLGADAALLGSFFRSMDKDKKKGLHRSWFTNLVNAYVHHRNARRGELRAPDGTEGERALKLIEIACVKASFTGAAAGLLSTGATVVTAETQGVGAFIALPVAAAAIGGEMFYRAVIHLEMTCDLAELFGVPFEPDDTGELWRVYALAFNTHDHDEDDPAHELVHKVAEAEGEQVGEAIGGKLLGESVLRNVLPFVGIATSSVQNWRLTKRLGDTVRRYVRYQRALRDALERDRSACQAHLELLVEGFWFVFTADGNLAEEEAATLAKIYDRFDDAKKLELKARFIADESGFLHRCSELPQEVRDAFLHALEVAAAVDKEFTLPEQKFLERCAHALGRPFKPQKVHEMMRIFEEKGVLVGAHHVVSPHPGAPGQPTPQPA
jgi:hypothetical protein